MLFDKNKGENSLRLKYNKKQVLHKLTYQHWEVEKYYVIDLLMLK